MAVTFTFTRLTQAVVQDQLAEDGGLWAGSTIRDLITEIEGVRSALLDREAALDFAQFGDQIQSARNLVHYLALRSFDLRATQERLAALGISSLGRSEGHVLYNLDVVIAILYRLAGLPQPRRMVEGVTPSEGRHILERNATRLLGHSREKRGNRIMVTMPGQSATDYGLVRDLLASGMDCMRINCAHDTESDWASMISNLRRAEKELGRKCRILMDIAGPKLRTGPLKPGPRVVRIRPKRDSLGRVLKPARVWLTPNEGREAPAELAEVTLPLPREFLKALRPRSVLHLRDARGSKRTLHIQSRRGSSFWASSKKTAYVTNETVLSSGHTRAKIGSLPAVVQPISLKIGDILIVSGKRIEGKDASRDAAGRVISPAVVSCTLPRALAAVRRGQPMWFDDGKIGGIVVSATKRQARVRITHAAEGGSGLEGDKVINLPKTDLRLPPITRKDIKDLEFITKHADLVGYSFVRAPENIDLLRSTLMKKGAGDMGIVLKIETLQAFEHLPGILLAAMRAPLVGVMIARGDLAVECGYERLSEVQEEILWLCEAADMPTIWATQVLEGLTKNGIPSRAEVTDAAMGERAECVMLNKGSHIVEAVKALDNILERMQAHQAKKSSLLRHLSIAEGFFEDHESGLRLPPRA
jgi:pyruvate kinase